MSNTETTAVAERRPNPMAEIRHGLEQMEGQFKFALPAHIPVERFVRVVMTAVQGNPYLLQADRRSLFGAAMKAAQDGLLADGREGALVPYKNEVTWIPMVAGLRKKVRNSGEIATWDVVAVYENDKFEFELGDDPFIRHAPALDNPGRLIAVYSIATLKGGEKSRDVMGVAAVERIRDRSSAWKLFKAGKIKSTPWQTDFDEMAKKTVARRHSKTLPMSTDLDDLLRRDDALYNYEEAGDAAVKGGGAPASLNDRLAALATPAAAQETAAEETGEIVDNETGEIVTKDSDAPTATSAKSEAGAEDARDGASTPAHSPWFAKGSEAFDAGMSRKAIPGEIRGDDEAAAEWLAGFDSKKDASP